MHMNMEYKRKEENKGSTTLGPLGFKIKKKAKVQGEGGGWDEKIPTS